MLPVMWDHRYLFGDPVRFQFFGVHITHSWAGPCLREALFVTTKVYGWLWAYMRAGTHCLPLCFWQVPQGWHPWPPQSACLTPAQWPAVSLQVWGSLSTWGPGPLGRGGWLPWRPSGVLLLKGARCWTWLVSVTWLEPVNQKVTDSIPGQGTYLVVGSLPNRGTYRGQPGNVPFSISLSTSSLQRIGGGAFWLSIGVK